MSDNRTGTIVKVSGPLVVAKGMSDAKMYEVVRVSEEGLVGEVIELEGDMASIQVYEETAGVGPGEPVTLTGDTMSVELAPGLLESIYDGIQRPLALIEEASGAFMKRGIDVPAINKEKKWDFDAVANKGDEVSQGDVLGTVEETVLIQHKVMVPPGVSGVIEEIHGGSKTVEETVAVIKDADGNKHEVAMLQKWPIREPRPANGKLVPKKPLITGVRILDTLFPLVQGGAGCIPGPFGAGKTVTQQSLAKFCNAQIIVYIGCGERGNEMTEVLMEFPHLKDPNSGEALMKRTIMIANTSNMPVAAREASVYTGITIAEYYRDMGYDVALMADSTSRWAEAMREMSGRLEEMPGEEGYPAYLGSRTAQFYERAGIVDCLGSDDRVGSLTVVGAVSPPGGDLSEPVTQNTLRVTKVFWGLDAKLAYRRHFPAINWLNSYSLYYDNVDGYMRSEVAEDYVENRGIAMNILQEESKLEEIVRLVGVDALSARERIVLETAKSLREDFLFQNAFDEQDAYTPIENQYQLLKTLLTMYHEGLKLVENKEFDINKLLELDVVKEELPKAKWLKEEGEFASLRDKVTKEFARIAA